MLTLLCWHYHWHCIVVTALLTLYHWHCNADTGVLIHYHWHCCVDTLPLTLQCWHCCVDTLPLTLQCWHSAVDTVLLCLGRRPDLVSHGGQGSTQPSASLWPHSKRLRHWPMCPGRSKVIVRVTLKSSCCHWAGSTTQGQKCPLLFDWMVSGLTYLKTAAIVLGEFSLEREDKSFDLFNLNIHDLKIFMDLSLTLVKLLIVTGSIQPVSS